VATKIAILTALDRIAHRWRKGQAWIDREADEWARHAPINAASDDRLELAVTRFIAGPGSYALQGLLDLLRTSSSPTADVCPNCVSGWVEVAIWRKGRVIEAALKCPSCRGGTPIGEVCTGWLARDATIDNILTAQDSAGRWRPLTAAERGKKEQHDNRKN